MTKALNDLLSSFRNAAKTEREKGTYFERLAIAFLKNDPVQAVQYEEVWSFSDWAQQQGIDRRDTGIDLVAKLKDAEGYCAIQCKFYEADKKIARSEIDSFFAASGKAPFTRRLIIDTTDAEWSEHAENALKDQHIETLRIGLTDLSESPIDWGVYRREQKVVLAPKKQLRKHQAEALDAVENGLKDADRGKLIMACGTGKTFTSLKIAERLAGQGKIVLFLVPSLALMSQSVREWTNDSETLLRSFAVCSDSQVGKRRNGDDVADLEIHDLAFPATTDAKKLVDKIAHPAEDRMTVVFSTYQSIQVISDAQKNHGLPEFDLIICDEAHRTTGAVFANGDESNFVKIHRQDFISGKKRLYMTATPRIFGDAVKTKANEAAVELCSMDDTNLYGEVLFQRGFSWAVQNGLLTDYKVIVLAVDEEMVSTGVQKRLTDANSELLLDDATKIIGCYKALTKADLKADVSSDPHPMKRAIAFCKDIRSSKLITNEFKAVVEEYLDGGNVMDGFPGDTYQLDCQLEHVDGTFNAKSRTLLLDWLKEDSEGDTCRILSNARCLSEGVDVPALDAIMFLHPRKSQIDVVQSVGRVMRRAEGKKMGYVILPVGIPAGVSPEEALKNNEKYRVVWQILNALRAHDDRFDATINKMDLGVDVSGHIEVIAVTNQLPTKTMAKRSGVGIGRGSASDDEVYGDDPATGQQSAVQTAFVFDEFSSAIMAKIVKKCGKRTYWEDWAGDIAKIAQTHITRIKALLEQPDTRERAAFETFLEELRDDLNDSITEVEAIEMLAQHLITKPVFEALFEGYSFTSENPVSRAMQSILEVLHEQNLEKEAQSLQKFYDSVKLRAAGIDNAEGKQRIIVELYDKFFRNAFPKMTERLGIVYTPVEVVDFIIHSVNDVLQAEFGQTLGSKGVHIIDPFVGTGTFVTRLLQSGLIKPDQLEHKYTHEIHANEIVLLAYYIAAINIEAVYHSLSGGDYKPFEGICLTDTFQLYEQERDLISDLMADNSSRRARQKALDIRVIMGNPPYSVGQESVNDNNANQSYPKLDESIRSTYVERSMATNSNGLYNSYIRAFRWASDRVGKSGIVAFVSNAGWVDGNATDGLRKCLADEFANIYVFHLRGNQRTSGERSRREGGKIFGSGSRTPVAITLLVKNPDATAHGQIYFHDVGDYLSREEKLAIVAKFGSIRGISEANGWQTIEPDNHGDWLNQRDSNFSELFPLGDKDNPTAPKLFANYSRGIVTQRDSWCFNGSRDALASNIQRTIEFYNAEVNRLNAAIPVSDRKAREAAVDTFINTNPTKVSWTRALKQDLVRGKRFAFDDSSFTRSLYRPFTKQWLYFNRSMNEMVYQIPRLFPDAAAENRIIGVSAPGNIAGFTVLMSDAVPELCISAMKGGTQCFPRYVYDVVEEIPETAQGGLFDQVGQSVGGYTRRDAITDEGLAHFRLAYPGEAITKDDLFFYVYGVLHSEDYRERFADNLSKELPRIPVVKGAANFWAFVEAGRKLSELHIGYETVAPFPVTIAQGDLRLANIANPESFYRVEQMRFAGKRPHLDKTTVIYNANITMTGIPLEAYEYVVNGKPALEWVMERQVVKTDKNSGIVNDANLYAVETVGDPAYPLKLFQRIITVSLETMKIVRSLPSLEIALVTSAQDRVAAE
ncbi:DEAD/DEAH box helicase [Microvirga sp. GCM10011540]|uniref:DEAD/DEAH box helicase n=1 Tax=Microvirga sp. GCM10011540 TaxID=3317338 RepID=UPI00360B2EBA